MQVVRVNFDQGRKRGKTCIKERLKTWGVCTNIRKGKRVSHGYEK